MKLYVSVNKNITEERMTENTNIKGITHNINCGISVEKVRLGAALYREVPVVPAPAEGAHWQSDHVTSQYCCDVTLTQAYLSIQ